MLEMLCYVRLGYVMVTVYTILALSQFTWAINQRNSAEASQSEFKPPNIILFLADDVGYGDFQSYGHPTQEYGGIDRMAKEGMRFTQWNAPAILCSPSRMATLTGRYAVRSGVFGETQVFYHNSKNGIPRQEVTIAEMLKTRGYKTGMVGKWHLGINKENNTDGYHLPHNHGFDFVGTNIPLTNAYFCNPKQYTIDQMAKWCFIYNGSKIVQQPADLTTVTDRMLTDAKHFIRNVHKENFFLYFSFSQAHYPLFSHPRFSGSSKRGAYGDNINEMASSVDEILDYLIELNVHESTLVLFMSDHGPEVIGCPDGGNSGPFKGAKGFSWEGGVRVPAIAWWPTKIPSSSMSTAPTNTMDLFPTFKELTKNKYVDDKDESDELLWPPLDGVKINSILRHVSEENCFDEPITPRYMFYYCGQLLTAVRYGDFKLHYMIKPFPIPLDWQPKDCNSITIQEISKSFDCKWYEKLETPLLFNLESDPGENYPLDVSKHQDLIKEIEEITDKHKSTVVDVEPLLVPGFPELTPCCNPPLCICNYNVKP